MVVINIFFFYIRRFSSIYFYKLKAAERYNDLLGYISPNPWKSILLIFLPLRDALHSRLNICQVAFSSTSSELNQFHIFQFW